MASLTISVNAVLPMFLVIGLGYLARRVKLLDESWLAHLNRLVFVLLLPLKLFYNVYTSDFGAVFRGRLIVFIVVMTFVSYGVIFALVMRLEKRDEKRGIMIQALYRANYVILGIPVVAALVGESGMGATSAVAAVAVPLGNALAVFTLQRFCGKSRDWKTVAKKIGTNPLIIGTACGIFARLLHIQMPTFLETAVSSTAAAATPMALLVLGGFFHFEDVSARKREVFWCTLGKLVLIPACLLTLAIILGFRSTDLAIILAYFASPCGPTSFTMAKQIGGDTKLAGSAVVVESVCASVTLTLFAFLLIQFDFM